MRNGAAAVLGLLTVVSTLLAPSHAHAQALRTLSSAIKPAPVGSICGAPVPRPQTMPPAGSGPVVYLIGPCFERQGGRPRFEPETYLKDILLKPSRPRSGEWTPYDAFAEQGRDLVRAQVRADRDGHAA